VEGNFFTFGLIYNFCAGSQKINILTAQNKQISNEHGFKTFVFGFIVFHEFVTKVMDPALTIHRILSLSLNMN
jgi:hypothetical protein